MAPIDHDLVANPHDQQRRAAATTKLLCKALINVKCASSFVMPLCMFPRRVAEGDPGFVNASFVK
jgi:hypothetical protein